MGLALSRKTRAMQNMLRPAFPHCVSAGNKGWEPPKALPRRRTLFDLSPATHCSILGTCLTLGELRKAVVKIAGENVRDLSNHEIHTLGVRYAATGGPPPNCSTSASTRSTRRRSSASRKYRARKI